MSKCICNPETGIYNHPSADVCEGQERRQLPTETDIELEVCEDCAMLIANGETPEDNPDFDLLPEWDDWHIALNCDEDGLSCEGFTWSQCRGCGSRLGGSRHPAIAWHRRDNA